MSYQLTFGGNSVQLVRDKGTANVVQGFQTNEVTICKNNVALTTTFIFQAFEYVQIPLNLGTIVWIKVSGIWKTTTVFIKVSGVWKQATTFIKISGIWR
jgi:hypothetical protein